MQRPERGDLFPQPRQQPPELPLSGMSMPSATNSVSSGSCRNAGFVSPHANFFSPANVWATPHAGSTCFGDQTGGGGAAPAFGGFTPVSGANPSARSSVVMPGAGTGPSLAFATLSQQSNGGQNQNLQNATSCSEISGPNNTAAATPHVPLISVNSLGANLNSALSVSSNSGTTQNAQSNGAIN